MTYKVAIKNNATGETRFFKMGLEWDNDYIWVDGNYSCDCNRHLFFEQAGGVEDGSEWDGAECGHEKYSCLYAELEDGTCIQLDDER